MGQRNKLAIVSFLILTFLGRNLAFSTPDTSMSISPSASSGETITASDENSRNNEISTKFNTHSHTDITALSGINTLTIGDGAVGNKTYAVDTDQANNPGLRYNTTSDFWTLTNDGSTYLTAAHVANSGAALTSGSVLMGAGSGGIDTIGTMTDGQLIIGNTGDNPRAASLTAGDGVTLTTGAGTLEVDTFSTGFAAPGLTFSTSNVTGSASTSVRTDATIALFDATTPANLGTAATGSAGTAARRDHVHNDPSKWVLVESMTLSGTGVNSSATLLTTRDVYMVVFDNVRTEGGTFGMRFNADSGTNYEYTTLATTTLANTTGAQQIVLNATTTDITGFAVFNRPAPTSGNHGVAMFLGEATTSSAIPLRGCWTSAAAITTVNFLGTGSNVVSGKVHIYALVDQ